mgnify:CR=1 FL=1
MKFSNRTWASVLAGALALQPSVEARSAAEYASDARDAIVVLNNNWYLVKSGIWDDAWWNSANTLTTLADFASVRLDIANKLNLGGFIRNTYNQAQKSRTHTLKQMGTMGMVASVDCIDVGNGCANKPEFATFNFGVDADLDLDKRMFVNFINEFYDDQGWWALGLIRAYDVAQDREYLESAVKIFNDMETGLGGPCKGGIYWNKDRAYVNAISNELYLAVAASLAQRMPDNPTFLWAAKDQWKWFKGSGLINQNGLINDGLDDKCKNNGMATWSYNQGVVVGGLVELWKVTGDDDLLKEARTIAMAAIKRLSNKDGVLVETDGCELRSGNCGRDGAQFKGIFIRNLRYLHEVAPQPEYRKFILKNADSIVEHNRNRLGKLGVAWQGPFTSASAASHSSALDALVAAAAVA